MKQSEINKRNYIIIGLCAIVLMMVVGYAAFASNLKINGTAEVTSNWCVGFDTSKTSDYVATPGLTGGTTPTATMSYSGNTCGSESLQTGASLSASFKQPGDQVIYTFTIKNASSLNAKLDSITENLTTSNSAIEYTLSGAKANDILGPNDEATLVVTVRYKNSVTSQPEVTTWGLELKLNFSQTNDSPAPTPSQTTFTGTLYRKNVNSANIGDSILSVSGTKYVITDGNEIAPVAPYDDSTSCQTALTDFGNPPGFYCDEQTGMFGGVGEYTTSQSEIQSQSNYYYKHTVVNDIITESYVCFVSDTEHCMQGGYSSNYPANITLLQEQEEWFNNHSGRCIFAYKVASNTRGFRCSGGGLDEIDAYEDGSVEIFKDNDIRIFIPSLDVPNDPDAPLVD